MGAYKLAAQPAGTRQLAFLHLTLLPPPAPLRILLEPPTRLDLPAMDAEPGTVLEDVEWISRTKKNPPNFLASDAAPPPHLSRPALPAMPALCNAAAEHEAAFIAFFYFPKVQLDCRRACGAGQAAAATVPFSSASTAKRLFLRSFSVDQGSNMMEAAVSRLEAVTQRLEAFEV